MIKKRLLEMLTGSCEHKREDRGTTEEGKHVCLNCHEVLEPPTKVFRSYIKLRKHIQLRVGIPTDRSGKKMSDTPTFNVGLRYIIPESPFAVKRVWVTFNNKKDQKNFASMVERRMMLCQDDEAFNEVINEALDIIRDANPGVPEQVAESGDESSE